MRRLLPVVLLVAGCYQPRASTGAPCGGDGECPSGQTCLAGHCERPGALDPDASDLEPPPDAWSWAVATKVPGLDGASDEDDPSCTPDRLTVVFVSDRDGSDDIFLGTRMTTTEPFVVMPLPLLNDKTANESSPELTADGQAIYFTSDRTAGKGDVFVSFKLAGAWLPPIAVPELSAGNETDVAISPDELTAMVSRAGTLWIATRASPSAKFGAPVEVPSLAVPSADAAAPSITNNADRVYFQAGSARDLYQATRSGAGFTAPEVITELSTSGRDAAPFISADDRYLMFARGGDVFETTR